jgi:hypothetical protein
MRGGMPLTLLIVRLGRGETNVIINRITTTSGYLEESPVSFAPGLNCIIGSRGTCKSTLIETIRFAFAHEPERVKVMVEPGNDEPFQGLLAETLGPGSVRCEVTSDEGAAYIIEREIGEDARVYQDGVREHAHHTLFHEIEIFSQGDLQRLADDDERRLRLVDRRYSEVIETLHSDREERSARLASVGNELRTLRSEMAQIRRELQPRPEIVAQLQQLEESLPQTSSEFERERAQFERRERVLATIDAAIVLQQRLTAALLPAASLLEEFRTVASDLAAAQATVPVEPARTAVLAIVEDANGIREAAARIERLDLRQQRAEAKRLFDQENETFFRLRQLEQAANDALKRQSLLKRQVEIMDKRRRDLDGLDRREAQLSGERTRLRAEISAIDDRIFSLRVGEVDAINREHGSTVQLTVRTGNSSRGYADAVCDMLAGSRIRNQDDVANEIANTFAPSDLVDIVESGNAQRLADVLHRDLGQMNRVVTFLAENPTLYLLESAPPTTRLEITMYDGDEPKSVESLSKGQKATALLPLLLRPLPYPLLIDQPEDDLDNKFIFSSLVKTIQGLKQHRQLIFVTHNANIPVLGDADRVIVMNMRTPKRASPPLIGTVETQKQEILDLLEGGAAAFKLREAQYRDLLG